MMNEDGIKILVSGFPCSDSKILSNTFLKTSEELMNFLTAFLKVVDSGRDMTVITWTSKGLSEILSSKEYLR